MVTDNLWNYLFIYLFIYLFTKNPDNSNSPLTRTKSNFTLNSLPDQSFLLSSLDLG